MAFYRADREFWVADVRKGGKRCLMKTAAKSKAEAETTERDLQRLIDAEEHRQAAAPPPVPKTTLVAAIDPWVQRRAKRGVSNAEAERGHLTKHVVPFLGDVPLESVTTARALDLIDHLKGQDLAPRTIRNVHCSATLLWEHFVERGELTLNPWAAVRKKLPEIHDSDPEWRIESTFTHAEVERLIGDAAIPVERRVVNALLALAGLRIGEAAALCWRHYDPAIQPLGRLTIAWSNDKRTKTGDTRLVPVHPALARILDDWRTHGWPALMGREPKPNDLIALGPPGPRWSDAAFRDRFQHDLKRLGLRVEAGTLGKMRSPHSLRATFLTLAVNDGAVYEIVDRVLHRSRGRGAGHLYLRPAWEVLCREVAKLQIAVRCYQNATSGPNPAGSLDPVEGRDPSRPRRRSRFGSEGRPPGRPPERGGGGGEGST